MSAPRRLHSLATFVAGLALAAGAARAEAAERHERPRRVAEPAPLGFTSVPAFQVSGVRDAAGVATVVVCTNFSFAPMDLTLVVRDFDGAATCTLGVTGLPAQESATFATRAVALYTADATCAPAPGADGGWAVLSAAGRLHALVCTAQVVVGGPSGTTTVTRLPLFTGSGYLLRDRLFVDSFETGDSSRWSGTQQRESEALSIAAPPPDPRPWDGCRLPLRERTPVADEPAS